MPQVKIIQPLEEQVKRLRVAAYVRVSSDSEDQLNSFSVQMEHYTGLIKDNAEWNFAGIYADEGITGMAADKRESFQRLLKDCRAGKIDRILVKSISRFARNSADTISVTRELKQLGGSIYFEKEGIDTADMGSEMLLSMLGAVAQEESVSISRNLQWGIRKRMQKGEYVTASVPFGYSYIDRTLVPNEKEAAVVRDIFQYYISGMGMQEIVNELMRNGIQPPRKAKEWCISDIQYILTNEKYIGDSLLQKKLTVGEFPSRRVKNDGDLSQYYVENSHPAIIEKEVFAQAEKLIEQKRLTGSVHSVYPLSKKLVCGVCGTVFRRKTSGREFDTTTWVCRAHYLNTEKCPMKPVTETEIHRAFCFLYNKLLLHKTVILEGLLQDLQEIKRRDQCSHPDVIMMNRELLESLKQVHFLTQLHSKGVLSTDVYLERRTALDKKTAELQKKLLSSQQTNKLDEVIGQTEKLLSILYEGTPVTRFDADIFEDIVEKIEVSHEAFCFHLKNGLHLLEKR